VKIVYFVSRNYATIKKNTRFAFSIRLFTACKLLLVQEGGLRLPKQARDGRLQIAYKKVVTMHNPNRDILVLLKQELMTAQAMEREVSLLHELLYTVERLDNLVTAHELLDLNKFKVISKFAHIKNYLRSGKEKPFVFLNNLN